MAKAQLENGFTQIANELLEKICSAKLSQNEFKVLLAIIRLSYGWRQKDTGSRAGVGEIRKIAALPSNRIYLAVESLKTQNIIFCTKGYPNKYAINTQTTDWKLVQKIDQSRKQTSAESGLVQNPHHNIVQKVDYLPPTNQASEAADQTPKEIKEIKERKESEILPSDYYQKTLNALGLPSTGIISPRDHTVLVELFKKNCNFDDIEQARIKRKKNRLEWIQDTVCEMRDARLATVAKPDENGIPILPNGYMDWDNMSFEQKQFAIQRGYEK